MTAAKSWEKELEAEKYRLEVEVEDCESTIEELEVENQRLTERVESLQKENAAMLRQNVELAQMCDDNANAVRERGNELEAKNTFLRAENIAIAEKLEDALKKPIDTNLGENWDWLAGRMRELAKSNDILRDDNQRFAAQNKKSDETMAWLRGQVREGHEIIATIRAERDALREENARIAALLPDGADTGLPAKHGEVPETVKKILGEHVEQIAPGLYGVATTIVRVSEDFVVSGFDSIYVVRHVVQK